MSATGQELNWQAPERRAADALSILAETSEGAISVDRNSRITWISPRYVRLLGLEGEPQVVGRPVEEVIPESRLREVVETGRPLVEYRPNKRPFPQVRGVIQGNRAAVRPQVNTISG